MKPGLSENKQNIVVAAKKIVAEKGVNNTTLQAIADEAGISKGALYYHYNSKSSIIYDIMDNTFSRAKRLTENAVIRQMDEEQIKRRVNNIIRKTVSDTSTNRLFIHLVYEAFLGDDELKEKLAVKYEQWVTYIEDILVNIYNIPKSEKTRLLAMLIEAALDGFILKELIAVHMEEKEKALELIEMVFNGDIKEFSDLLS